MPIKKENRHRYPKDWKAISWAVRQEAGQRCEECRVCNGAVGYRHGRTRKFQALPFVNRSVVLSVLRHERGPSANLTKIVLTVHHIDGKPENSDRINLIALCQRCHLMADQKLLADRKNHEGLK